MSLLNSNFDIITNDPHACALAGLMLMIPVASPPAPAVSGTPTPGVIGAGTIVAMDANGEAVVADGAVNVAPSMLFVAVDGDKDNDGAFVHVLTCLQGGGEILTEQYASGVFVPGNPLACGTGADVGKFVVPAGSATEQLYGIVGPLGLDTVKGVLDVLIPQGISPEIA
jgi:hypothetical protein